MEFGIGLTFGAFIVELSVFFATVLTLAAKPALRKHAKLRSLMVGLTIVLALLTLMSPVVLLMDVLRGQSGFGWSYSVVLVCAPMLVGLTALMFRRVP